MKAINKDELFWKYSRNFLEEYNDPGITSPKDQLVNIVKYLLKKCPKILDRIQYYQEFIGISKNEYLNKYWTIYRPLPTNETIENEQVKMVIDTLTNKGISFEEEENFLPYVKIKKWLVTL